METNEFRRRNSNLWLGLFLMIIGVGWLLHSLGTIFPYWLFSWKTFLILLGLGIGIQNNFKGNGWMVLILIGSAFLLEDLYPALSLRNYLWPVLIIIFGVWLMIRPRGRRHFVNDERKQGITAGDNPSLFRETSYTDDDYIDTTSVFGGIKKVVLSKNFQGGDVVSILGGSEIDLSQADINGRVVLEVTVLLGGTKLFIPSHWELKSELVSVLAGIDDKREVVASSVDHDKVLVLKGTAILGGIDIRSYKS